MTTIATLASERLRLYRQSHRIELDDSDDPFVDRCDHDGIRVYQVVARRWRHDPSELERLQREAIEERVAAVIAEASAPLREFER